MNDYPLLICNNYCTCVPSHLPEENRNTAQDREKEAGEKEEIVTQRFHTFISKSTSFEQAGSRSAGTYF
jgi:hypothetical protein